MERKVLSIFLASPNDLSPERAMVKEIVGRLNSIHAKRLNWTIELLGWEDVMPGFSRPQEQINKDVEVCDLFIGILWKRWGTPSGTFASGFEEEFEIARSRRISDGHSPEIWLFFKKVDQEQCEDPGDQLKKVIDFKQKQIESKELLFKEFGESSDFEKNIHDLLSALIVDRHLKSKENVETKGKTPLDYSVLADERTSQFEGVTEENKEVCVLLNDISKKIESNESNELSFGDRTRMYLISSALFSNSHIGETFGTHEANLVYRNRKIWKLTDAEKTLLKRSYYKKNNQVIPGYYWMKDFTKDEAISVLKFFAFTT